MSDPIFRPLLAVDAEDLAALPYPLLASYKMDGIRALVTPEGARTRSLKPLPNRHAQALLSALPPGLDGEIGVVGEDGAINFRATTSAIMSRDGTPDFRYFIFDNYLSATTPYRTRYAALPREGLPSWVVLVSQREVHNADEVRALFATALAEGFEGLILRRADAPYKFGRSTLPEAILLKVKPWSDAEATIIDILPEYENTNKKTADERGYAKRSTKKEGRVQRDRMGTILVSNPARWPKPFEIGTGFTQADRETFWKSRTALIGGVIRFGFVTVGGYDVPRHCVFQGFRAPEDMSP